MPDCSLLGLGQGGVLEHFCSLQSLWVRLIHSFLYLHLLLLHVEQRVSACAVRVFAVHTAPPFWSSSVR